MTIQQQIIFYTAIAVYGFTIPGVIVLEAVKSWRKHGRFTEDVFFAFFPLFWIAAPVWFTFLAAEMSGYNNWYRNREAIKAWNLYDRHKLEAEIVPQIARTKNHNAYYGDPEYYYHANKPNANDPRKNPDPPELPGVRRVRQLMAEADMRDYIDIPKSEAANLINVYRKGARNARIEELENEMKELMT